MENRGYVKQADWKDAIKVGQTSKQEVAEKFGSPSTQSSFGVDTWYYISSRKEAIGFMKPSIVEQEAVDITFDSTGIVSSVNVYNQDNAKDFSLVKRTTPTEGHSLSFIDQALGNLGRFNNPGSTSSSGHRSAGSSGF
ncbi:MAG: outer membrane protein assembly factor BamE [Rickettsiales bacterium]